MLTMDDGADSAQFVNAKLSHEEFFCELDLRFMGLLGIFIKTADLDLVGSWAPCRAEISRVPCDDQAATPFVFQFVPLREEW